MKKREKANALLKQVHYAHMRVASRQQPALYPPKVGEDSSPQRELLKALTALNNWLEEKSNPEPDWRAQPTAHAVYYHSYAL